MVGPHHRITTSQLRRDDANGVDYNELEASSRAAKVNNATRFHNKKGGLIGVQNSAQIGLKEVSK